MNRLGAARLVGDYAPGTPGWQALRARRIGGSEIAAVFGYSPWESPFSLWHRKAGTIPPADGSDATWWGMELEDDVAARYAYCHPEVRLRRCGTYVSCERDYQLISPDRIVTYRDGRPWEPLEIKTAARDDEWGEPGTDEVPLAYRMQCLWALDALQRPTHRLAVYFGAADYREYVISYDAYDISIMRKRAVEFLDSIAAGELPSIDAHTATYRAIRAMHPDIDERAEIELDAELGAELAAALEAVAAADTRKRAAVARVADAMGDARYALYTDPARRDEHGAPITRRVAMRMVASKKDLDAVPYVKALPLPKTRQEIN